MKKRNRALRKIFTIILILIAVACALYVGIWEMFVLGIVQCINGIKANFDAMQIAIGLARIFIGTSVSEIVALILAAIGVTLW